MLNLRQDIALLVLRLGFGGLMLFAHGWGKLAHFSERMHQFSDPLGVGAPVSLGLATFAEVFCSLAVIAGFKTRLAALPLMATMSVAAFIVHANDPWARREFALMYLIAFAVIALAGAGKFSADASRVRGRLKRRARELSAAKGVRA